MPEQILTRSVLLISVFGILVMTAAVYYVFKRKALFGEKSGISQRVTVAVGIMSVLVAGLSAVESYFAKKSHAAPPVPTLSSHGRCSSDQTGKPYAEEIRFLPKDYVTGARSGDAMEWKFTKQMPGVVTVVTANSTGPFVRVNSCNADGETVICTGTLNTGEPTPIVVSVKWQQPCDDTVP